MKLRSKILHVVERAQIGSLPANGTSEYAEQAWLYVATIEQDLMGNQCSDVLHATILAVLVVLWQRLASVQMHHNQGPSFYLSPR